MRENFILHIPDIPARDNEKKIILFKVTLERKCVFWYNDIVIIKTI